jgi:PAS domain-containing protein
MRVAQRTSELARANQELRNEITDRQRVEEALRESEEKYRTLIENIQDGVFLIQDLKLQFVNEAFAKNGGLRGE